MFMDPLSATAAILGAQPAAFLFALGIVVFFKTLWGALGMRGTKSVPGLVTSLAWLTAAVGFATIKSIAYLRNTDVVPVSWSQWVAAGLGSFAIAGLVLGIWKGIDAYWRIRYRLASRWNPSFSLGFFDTPNTFRTIGALAGIVMVWYYSLTLYPSLPQSLGGLRPRCAQLNFSRDAVSPQDLTLLVGRYFQESKHGIVRSTPVAVLGETGDTLFVRPFRSLNVVEIRRTEVPVIFWSGGWCD